MAKRNDGGPAFPVPDNRDGVGMSLRDYFAAHAPLMPDEWADYRRTETVDFIAEDAQEVELMIEWRWAYADMMIARRIV